MSRLTTRLLLTSALALGASAVPAIAGEKLTLLDGREITGEVEHIEEKRLGIRPAGQDTIVWVLRSDIAIIDDVSAKPRTPVKSAARPVASHTSADLFGERLTLKDKRVLTGRVEVADRRRVGIRTMEGLRWVPRAAIEVMDDVTLSEPLPEKVTAQDAAALAKRIADDLGAESLPARVAAAQEITAGWPATDGALTAALEASSPVARREAVRLLAQSALGDTRDALRDAMRDSDDYVRIQALRAAARRGYADLEVDAIAVLRSASPWSVRQEAVRTLGAIGGAKAFGIIVVAWVDEDDDGRRRRYRRTMKQLLGEDLGDDDSLWLRAVTDVAGGARELPRKKRTRQ